MKGQQLKRLARLAAVSAALGTSLVLSGCGESNVAATVDGHVITESEVNSAVNEINEGLKLTKPLTAQQALTMLIIAPAVLDYADTHGFPQTESAARAALPLPEVSPATVRVLRLDAAAQQVSQADEVPLSKKLQELKVVVNPKYGSFDPDTAKMVAQTPNWLEFHNAN